MWCFSRKLAIELEFQFILQNASILLRAQFEFENINISKCSVSSPSERSVSVMSVGSTKYYFY